MEANKIFLGALVVGGTMYLLNRKKRQTEQENQVIDNVVESSDLNSKKATELKVLLNANDNFGFWTFDYISSANRVVTLFNIMNHVTNFSKFQDAFKSLCKGEKTLLDALQKACKQSVFEKAIEIAKAPKIKTIAETRCDIITATDDLTEIEESSFKTFSKNIIVGMKKNKNPFPMLTGTPFVYRFYDDGFLSLDLEEKIGYIPITSSYKIVNPT